MSFGSSPLATAKANGATGGTTAAVDTTGAKLIVVEAGFSGSVTISDSKGNTWTAGTLYNGSTPNTQFFYCLNPTVGTGHTFTITASVGSIVVTAWSATGTPALDSQATSNQATQTFGQFGSTDFTPTVAGCLLIAGASFASPGYTSGFAAASGWTLADVNNYVSGTSFGSSQVYQVQTTATTVPLTQHTSNWTGSVNVSFHGIAFKEVAGASLTVTTPSAFEVHQRSGTTGSIQITGSHAGATEDIEASFNGGAFATIATAVPAGNFSGTLTGQAQGMGTLTVRKKVTTSASANVANVGIGDVWLTGGDSLGQGRANNAQTYTAAGALKITDFRQDNAWKDGNDPSSTGTSIGSHWPLLGTLLLADTGVPHAFVTTAVGGTDCAGSNNTWAKPNSEYSAAVTTFGNSTAVAAKGALFQLGPNAIVNANNAAIALATYRTALGTLATNLAADIPGAPPLLVGIPGQVTTGAPPDRRTAEDNIRGAIIGAAGLATITLGPNLLGQAYLDGVHPQTDPLVLALAQRWWLAIKEKFFGGAVGSSRGPRFVSATWNLARNQLAVIFDRPLKTGLTHAPAAWIVNDVGGLGVMSVSSIAYHGTNPNGLLLNTTAAATGAANSSRVTFGSGEDATGVVIPLSTDITLPVGGPIQIPAEPFYTQNVGETTNLATTATITLTTNGSTPAANLTGLRWAWFDQALPSGFLAPTAKGSVATTDGAGVFSVSIVGTALSVGQTGYLLVTDTDGTVGQSPAAKRFGAPVQAA